MQLRVSQSVYCNMLNERKCVHYPIFKPFTYTESKQNLRIDSNSKRNLELLQSIRGGDQKGTLLWLLDETVTAMGGRKLKQWLHQPLASENAIEED